MITTFFARLLLGGLGSGVVAYGLMCLALFGGQKRLMYFPVRTLPYTPQDIALDYEDVWIPQLSLAGKLKKLHGWWIPHQNNTQDVLLYFHGNGSNMSGNLGTAQRYHELGFSVLMIDYSGYGRSEGKFPDEAQLYRDSQSAWDYLTQQRHINPENIFLFGHSLGGAIALDLAVRKPNAGGVIVQSSFTSMLQMVTRTRLYRLFPVNLILTQRFDSLAKLPLLRVPLLLIHGTEDRTVPPTMSQTLYDKADVPKQLYFVEGAGHNNVSSVGDGTYLETVRSFQSLVRENQRQVAAF